MEENEQSYIIPANAKKSRLLLGFFNTLDLFIFGFGILSTLFLLLKVQTSEFYLLVLIILPALISSFLVMPVPYYHNILQLLINVFTFFLNRRKYRWKGWCIHEEQE